MDKDYYEEYYTKKRSVRYMSFYRNLAEKIYAHGNVIDLGCGTGDFLKICKERMSVKSITGVDISQNAISCCYGGDFYCSPIENLKCLENNKYDIITCFGVLEHIENKSLVLRQIYSICDRLGTVVIMVPIKEFLFRKFGFKGTEQRFHREDVLSIEDWEKLFIENGFDVTGKWIDRHNLEPEWIFSKGLLMVPIKILMALFINVLPLKYTYQVFFKMRKRI